jgi:uncharacterized lipoprotein YmbA
MSAPLRFIPPAAWRWLAGAGLALVAGCNFLPAPQADPTRYYILTGGGVGDAIKAPAPDGFQLGLKPVGLASYLKGRPIVVRRSANEVAFVDEARWGEPLDAAVARVLRARLLEAPAVGQVYLPPFPLEGTRTYDVEVQVVRCEGGTARGGGAVASFAATIDISTTGAEHRTVAHRLFTAPDAPWDGKDFARLAALLSDDLTGLAQDILAALPPQG